VVSKLTLGVSVSVHGCVSSLYQSGPVMEWRPIQGVLCLSFNDSWDMLQPPQQPCIRLSGYRKWTVRWMDSLNEDRLGQNIVRCLTSYCGKISGFVWRLL